MTTPISEAQAIEIKSRFEPGVIGLPGVTGVDVGLRTVGASTTGELAIRVYVASRAHAPALPDQVEGLPVEIIERRFGLHG